MATSFRRPTQIVRRSLGFFNRGVWTAAVEPAPSTIMASVYASTSLDYERMRSGEFGRRSGEMKRLVTDCELNVARPDDSQHKGHPGDIVLHKDSRWLIISGADNTVMGTSVSHYLYLIVREIETEAGKDTL